MRKLLFLFTICSIQFVQAQKLSLKGKMVAYTFAGSGNYGVAARYNVDHITAIDGIISDNPGQQKLLLTGLYEQFYKVKKNTNLKWYAGLGMHIGYISHREEHTEIADVNKTDGVQSTINVSTITRKMVAGADATLGLQYSINNSPISIGLDTKPYMDFVNNSSQLFNYTVRIGYRF